MRADFVDLQIPQSLSAVYEWSADHAADVHDGEITSDGLYKPGRPWTRVAIKRSDVLGNIAAAFKAGHSITNAFTIAAFALDGEFKDAIEDPIYEWPRVTRRTNGQVVGSPRDIVDRGTLRDSQSMTIEVIR
jgi:hypothetical protein